MTAGSTLQQHRVTGFTPPLQVVQLSTYSKSPSRGAASWQFRATITDDTAKHFVARPKPALLHGTDTITGSSDIESKKPY
jgi:hypothetical protein